MSYVPPSLSIPVILQEGYIPPDLAIPVISCGILPGDTILADAAVLGPTGEIFVTTSELASHRICLDSALTGGYIELGDSCGQDTSIVYNRTSISSPLAQVSSYVEECTFSITRANSPLGSVYSAAIESCEANVSISSSLGRLSAVASSTTTLKGVSLSPLGTPRAALYRDIVASGSIVSPLGAPAGSVTWTNPNPYYLITTKAYPSTIFKNGDYNNPILLGSGWDSTTYNISVSGKGDRVAELSNSHGISVYDVISDTTYTLNDPTLAMQVSWGYLQSIAFSVDGRYIAVSGTVLGNYLQVIDTNDWSFVYIPGLVGNINNYKSCVFTSDGKYLVVGVDYNWLDLYKLEDWTKTRISVSANSPVIIVAVPFSSDVIVVDSGTSVTRVNADTKAFQWVVNLGHIPNDLCFSPDGKYAVELYAPNLSCRVINPTTFSTVVNISINSTIREASFSPDSKVLAVRGTTALTEIQVGTWTSATVWSGAAGNSFAYLQANYEIAVDRVYGSIVTPLGAISSEISQRDILYSSLYFLCPLGTPSSVLNSLTNINFSAIITVPSPLGRVTESSVFTDVDVGPGYGCGVGDRTLRARGMMLIPPGTIIREMLVSSTASQDALPAWSETKCYRRGDQVSTWDGRMWEAVYNKITAKYNNCRTLYNIGKNPITAVIPSDLCKYEHDNQAWWHEVTVPANDMRMFDLDLETETVAVGPLIVEVNPTFEFNSFAMFGVTASAVEVWMGDKYYRYFDLKYENPKFDSVLYKDTLVETNLPLIPGLTLKFVFHGVGPNLLVATNTVKVGVVVIGLRQFIGLDCYSTEVGITDYSKKDRDVFGLPVLVQDTYSDKVSYVFEAEAEYIYHVRDLVAKYRAKPIAYIGYAPREETCIFGLYQDFRIPVDNWAVCTGTLDVLGMPTYWDRPFDDICGNDDLADGNTMFVCDGVSQDKTAQLVCGNQGVPLLGVATDLSENELDVGPNGSLFYNYKRTAFSPWYTQNINSADYGRPTNTEAGVWCIVGDDGLIAISHNGTDWEQKDSPLGAVDYELVIAYPSVPWNPATFFMATTSCFSQRVYSYDMGRTWKTADDHPEMNIFDTDLGIFSGNTDDVHFNKMRAFDCAYDNSVIAVMGGEAGEVHFMPMYSPLTNGQWQTKIVDPTNDPAFYPEISLEFVSAAIGPDVTVFVSKDLIACTNNSTSMEANAFSRWVFYPNPFSSNIVRVFYLFNEFMVTSDSGQYQFYGVSSLDLYMDGQISEVCMGTLSPLSVWDIGCYTPN